MELIHKKNNFDSLEQPKHLVHELGDFLVLRTKVHSHEIANATTLLIEPKTLAIDGIYVFSVNALTRHKESISTTHFGNPLCNANSRAKRTPLASASITEATINIGFAPVTKTLTYES